MSNTITTHVLDTATGSPAAGMAISLFRLEGEEYVPLVVAQTNDDGRVPGFTADIKISAGKYRMIFDTGPYHEKQGVDSFYPEVQVHFAIANPEQHYHVPLLISPFGFSTYRGS